MTKEGWHSIEHKIHWWSIKQHWELSVIIFNMALNPFMLHSIALTSVGFYSIEHWIHWCTNQYQLIRWNVYGYHIEIIDITFNFIDFSWISLNIPLNSQYHTLNIFDFSGVLFNNIASITFTSIGFHSIEYWIHYFPIQ